MKITTCVFDAYGTLFDVAAAARNLAERPGAGRLAEIWPQLAETWRAKQLEYTWLRAAAGVHTDFRAVTRDGLDYAAEALGGLTEAEKTELMALYDELEAYPEVPAMLAALKAKGVRTAILSNGSPAMLESAAKAAKLDHVLDALISVEGCGVFKPAHAVYDLVHRQFGTASREVLFVSSNGWDAAAAAGYGFRTLWVNRMGKPMDRLPWKPEAVAQDLTGVPAHAEGL